MMFQAPSGINLGKKVIKTASSLGILGYTIQSLPTYKFNQLNLKKPWKFSNILIVFNLKLTDISWKCHFL